MILTKLCGCCSGVILGAGEHREHNEKCGYLRKAARASIVIRTVQTFLGQGEYQDVPFREFTHVSVPVDLRITHVTDSVVQDRLGF